MYIHPHIYIYNTLQNSVMIHFSPTANGNAPYFLHIIIMCYHKTVQTTLKIYIQYDKKCEFHWFFFKQQVINEFTLFLLLIYNYYQQP